MLDVHGFDPVLGFAVRWRQACYDLKMPLCGCLDLAALGMEEHHLADLKSMLGHRGASQGFMPMLFVTGDNQLGTVSVVRLLVIRIFCIISRKQANSRREYSLHALHFL